MNIASINGRKPWVDTPAYSASKAAVINLTQALAMKHGADNINVNAVCPGGVMTAMAHAFTKDGKTHGGRIDSVAPSQAILVAGRHRPRRGVSGIAAGTKHYRTGH